MIMKIKHIIYSDYIFEQLAEKKQKSFQNQGYRFHIESLSQNGSELLVKCRIEIPYIHRLGNYYDFIIRKTNNK